MTTRHKRARDGRHKRARDGRSKRALAGIGLALATVLGGCSLSPTGGGGDREMTVYLPKARSFYKESKVKVMGADVGSVDSVQTDGDRIRVRFHISRDVPLPKGVQAAIVPLNLVGERNLVLHPAWKPGDPKETSDTIPIERTSVPVEVDDALNSFTNLARALDPTKVQPALDQTANSFNGNGRTFNATLEESARLVQNVAGQDKNLIAVASNLHRLAGVVRGREQVLGEVIQDFSTASRVLAGERGEIQDLVHGLVDLSRNGQRLLDKYKGQLPDDLAVLTRVALILKGNAARLAQLVKALPSLSGALIDGYNPKNKSLQIRVATDAFLRTWLKSILRDDNVGCPLPKPNSNCPWPGSGDITGGH